MGHGELLLGVAEGNQATVIAADQRTTRQQRPAAGAAPGRTALLEAIKGATGLVSATGTSSTAAATATCGQAALVITLVTSECTIKSMATGIMQTLGGEVLVGFMAPGAAVQALVLVGALVLGVSGLGQVVRALWLLAG